MKRVFRKQRQVMGKSGQEYTDIVNLWIMRILLPLGGHQELIKECRFTNNDLIEYLNLERFDNALNRPLDPDGALQDIKSQYQSIRSKQPRLVSGHLYENLQWLSAEIGLTAAENKILSFAVLLSEYPELEEATDILGNIRKNKLIYVLATILGVRKEHMRKALGVDSKLYRSGILLQQSTTLAHTDLISRLELIEGLSFTLLQPHKYPEKLLSQYFSHSLKPTISLKDFYYLERETRLITRYLKNIKQRHKKGINILIYGQPGTGKTEFSRVLAEKLGMSLYEIGMKGAAGNAISGEQRFNMYQLAQSLLARKKGALILFDEVEDVFPAHGDNFLSNVNSVQGRKAWINRLLEENPVPAIWLTNDTQHIDPAILRRFDIVIDLPVPTRKTRKKILEKYLKGMHVSQKWIDRTAENESLAPAYISRSAKVARQINADDIEETEKTLDYLLENTLKVTAGQYRHSKPKQNVLPYCLDVLNTNSDMTQLRDGLAHVTDARICLYGPPGTGKTIFGEYLAKELDRPLIAKQASSIFSRYVGGTEKNIAEMFQDAERENAVLLLDEADSFLRDRKSAKYSWEMTQVNELLVQMENFNSIFIASTNLMSTLDEASLRRFDFKIEFGYLKPEQIWQLFELALEKHGGSHEKNKGVYKPKVGKLLNLTPGDFSTVIRKNNIFGNRLVPEFLYEGLIDESKAKSGSNIRSIGFLN